MKNKIKKQWETLNSALIHVFISWKKVKIIGGVIKNLLSTKHILWVQENS